jgi:hypothetical protein
VKNFLSVHGLSHYGTEFVEAIRTDRLSPVAANIFEDTGYEMIQLEMLPKHIRKRYGSLCLSPGSGQEKMYLLFWEPTLRVTNFYPGYKGDEIKRLEALLAMENLYTRALDGIVGPKLWYAVKRFQQKQGLKMTGFPDKETVFLLCHENRDKNT